MSIQFIPLGIPLTNTYALTSSVALTAGNTPTTASLAAFADNLIGVPGDPYSEIDASPTLIPAT